MTEEELEAEFVRLSETAEMDKILRMLRSHRDQVPREVVRECLQEACLEVVKRQRNGGVITGVAGLLVTIGRRLVAKAATEMDEGREVDAGFARREREAGAWEHDDVWHAAIERATEYVFKAVVDWPADNLRRTILTMIDAANDGVQLRPVDLDRILGCANGTGRVWRDRAIDRLRAQFVRDGISWEIAAALLPEEADGDNEQALDDEFDDFEEDE